MPNKRTILFDELDKKVLEEIPLLAEILSSTSKKITALFDTLFESIYSACSKNIPKGLEIDKKSIKNKIHPFTTFEERDISYLECHFEIFNKISFVTKDNKQSGKKIAFHVYFGLYFDNDDWKIPVFYFGIYNYAPDENKILHNLNYYEDLKREFKDYKLSFEHPTLGHDNEKVEIIVNIKEIETLNHVSNEFSSNILPIYLNTLNDVK